jgi:antirestriction protein ArdC
VTDENGEEHDETYPVLRSSYLFNVEQCDGLPARVTAKPEPISEPEGIANADAFLAAVGADVRHGRNRPFYTTAGDLHGRQQGQRSG